MQQPAGSVQDREFTGVCGGKYSLEIDYKDAAHGTAVLLLECDLRPHVGRCRMEWNNNLILFFDKENSEGREENTARTAKTA
jgi:hypothetical protein